MKSPKNIQKSIRITEKVAEYIEQQNGEGFNEKFCNMVMYCMEKEAELKRQEKLFICFITVWSVHLKPMFI